MLRCTTYACPEAACYDVYTQQLAADDQPQCISSRICTCVPRTSLSRRDQVHLATYSNFVPHRYSSRSIDVVPQTCLSMRTPAKENVPATALPVSPSPSLLKQPTARTPRTVTPSKPTGYATPTRSKLAPSQPATPQPDLNDKGTHVLLVLQSHQLPPLQSVCARSCGYAQPNHTRQQAPSMYTTTAAHSRCTRASRAAL